MFVLGAWPTLLFFIFMGIGTLLILISYLFKSTTTPWQLFISIIPLIILYALFHHYSASKDIFLIPEGFRGEVIIYYDRKDGQKEQFEGNWRLYNVPENGILKTMFKIKGHKINLTGSKYYFIDSSGKRTEIKHYCEYCKVKDAQSIQVIYGVVGVDLNGHYQTFKIDKPMLYK
jgi:hypothetical protein